MISNLSEVNLRDGLFLSFLRRFWFRSVHHFQKLTRSSSHSAVKISLDCNDSL